MHDNYLAGKVAVVTGGSRGIGRAIVNRVARLGAAVVFNYRSDRKSADSLVREIRANGGEATSQAADMRDAAGIEELFDTALGRHGRLDILVNNAGIAIYKKIEEFSEEELDEILSINVKAVFLCCRQAALKMADGGSIINIGSSVTRMMLPKYAAYAASKGAVEQLSKVLAAELGGRGIRVNTLSPGPVDTELFRRGKTAEQIAYLGSLAALERIGTVDDVADMVALLLDRRSAWVTGQNILVNGGLTA